MGAIISICGASSSLGAGNGREAGRAAGRPTGDRPGDAGLLARAGLEGDSGQSRCLNVFAAASRARVPMLGRGLARASPLGGDATDRGASREVPAAVLDVAVVVVAAAAVAAASAAAFAAASAAVSAAASAIAASSILRLPDGGADEEAAFTIAVAGVAAGDASFRRAAAHASNKELTVPGSGLQVLRRSVASPAAAASPRDSQVRT